DGGGGHRFAPRGFFVATARNPRGGSRPHAHRFRVEPGRGHGAARSGGDLAAAPRRLSRLSARGNLHRPLRTAPSRGVARRRVFSCIDVQGWRQYHRPFGRRLPDLAHHQSRRQGGALRDCQRVAEGTTTADPGVEWWRGEPRGRRTLGLAKGPVPLRLRKPWWGRGWWG